MSQSASKLTQVGADFIICPNNTLHKAFDLVESPIPWLHIAKPVVKEIARGAIWRVGEFDGGRHGCEVGLPEMRGNGVIAIQAARPDS